MDNVEIAYNRFIQRFRVYGLSVNKPLEWFIIFSRKTQAQMIFWHLADIRENNKPTGTRTIWDKTLP